MSFIVLRMAFSIRWYGFCNTVRIFCATGHGCCSQFLDREVIEAFLRAGAPRTVDVQAAVNAQCQNRQGALSCMDAAGFTDQGSHERSFAFKLECGPSVSLQES